MPRELLLRCCCSYVTSMSQARVPRLFWQEGRLSEKVLPLPQSALLLNFGRNAAESCNQLAAFLQSPSRSLSSLSLPLCHSLGLRSGSLLWAHLLARWRLPVFAIFGHLPRPAWDQSCHSCTHSFAHSLSHSLTHCLIHSLHSHYFVACVMS